MSHFTFALALALVVALLSMTSAAQLGCLSGDCKSTSLTSSSKSSPTPYVIAPNKNIPEKQKELVTLELQKIAEKDTVETVSGLDGIELWLANLDEDGAKTMKSNPAVSKVFKDFPISFDIPPRRNETESGWARRSISDKALKTGPRLTKRDDTYSNQEFSLRDLEILSLPERIPLSQGHGYDYPSRAGTGITIYLIDTGVNPNHPEWIGGGETRGTRREILVSSRDRVMSDALGHGTCVMSKAAGQQVGLAKNANMVMVKLPTPHPDPKGPRDPNDEMIEVFSVSNIIRGLRKVVNDVKDPRNPKRGKAVVNMSFYWTATESQHRSWDIRDALDLYRDELDELIELDVVLVTASGNLRDISDKVNSWPSVFAFGSHGLPIIVVGAVDNEGLRTEYSQGFDELTTSAPGNILCANYQNDELYYQAATSYAAPSVAGIVATMLSEPELYPRLQIRGWVSYEASRIIKRLSYRRPNYSRLPTDGIPLPPVAYNGVDNYPGAPTTPRRYKRDISRSLSSQVYKRTVAGSPSQDRKREDHTPSASGAYRTSNMENFSGGFSWNLCLFSNNVIFGFSIMQTAIDPYGYRILTDCFDGDYSVHLFLNNGTQMSVDLTGKTQDKVIEANLQGVENPVIGYFIEGLQH